MRLDDDLQVNSLVTFVTATPCLRKTAAYGVRFQSSYY